MKRNSVRWIAVMTWAAVAILAAASGPAQAAGKIALRLNLKEGQTYPLRMLMNQNNAVDTGDQATNVKTSVGIGLAFTVDKIEADGTMDVSVVYNWVLYKHDMAVRGMDMNIEYDSSQTDVPVTSQTKRFAALVGLGYQMTIAPDGTVKSVTGLDEMRAKIIEKMKLRAGLMTERMKTMLERQYDEQSVKDDMTQMLPLLPKEPVGIGDSWSTTKDMPLMSDCFTAKVTCTLKDIKDGVATLAFVYTFAPGKDAAPAADQTQTSASFTGKIEGTADVDAATGWPAGGQATMNISGTADTGQPVTITGDVTLQPKAENAQ